MEEGWHAGGFVGRAFFKYGQLTGGNIVGLELGGHIKEKGTPVHFSLELSAMRPDRYVGNLWNDLVSDPIEYGIGMNVRGHFTPAHTFVGAYLIGGGRASFLKFDYVDGLAVDYGNITEVVADDWVAVLQLYLGVGVSLVQTEVLHLGMHVSGGYRFYPGGDTDKGVPNEFFDDEAFIQVIFPVTGGNW